RSANIHLLGRGERQIVCNSWQVSDNRPRRISGGRRRAKHGLTSVFVGHHSQGRHLHCWIHPYVPAFQRHTQQNMIELSGQGGPIRVLVLEGQINGRLKVQRARKRSQQRGLVFL